MSDFGIRAARQRHEDEVHYLERTRTWAKGEAGDALLRSHLARNSIEFKRDLLVALQENGVPAVLDETALAWMTEVILGVPELAVRIEFSVQRDQQQQRAIRSNDRRDIDALCVAIPHCDVVVTEKLWADLSRRARFGERFGARITPDLREIPETLNRSFNRGEPA